MEYTVAKLARLAGVSARTLRFYDEIGLLRPCRVTSAGYRIYGEAEVDTLQQILFFRALGLDLQTIASVLGDASFDRKRALREHLSALTAEKARLDVLIDTVQKTILKEEGEITMTDQEKFEGLKKRLVAENEAQYGEEIRERYGEDTVEESNRKMLRMSKETYDAMQQLSAEILQSLAEAVRTGEAPESAAGQAVAGMHKRWLSYTWPSYSSEAHAGLVQMYVDDERFTAFYDKDQPGCARFLRDAVLAWLGA